MRMHKGLFRSERGSSLVEVAIILPTMVMLALGVVDFGRAYYLANEVAGAAHAGAMYGSQNPTDTATMITLAKADAPDVSGIGATASYGCECSDGTSASASCASKPSCTNTVVYYVKVTATAPYTLMIPWPGFRSSVTLSNTVEMRSSYQ
jgi:Flp pilus assembly protein TadG